MNDLSKYIKRKNKVIDKYIYDIYSSKWVGKQIPYTIYLF